ncbi:hypothetical protein LIER_11108 [Lithospermum erythrorhizon]|uniref:Uncharacterized protein n=1 Tax=Lithospermum erythrorhizon TaxID=34254 RepID=A0AAV3PPP1_LITER
MYAAKDHGIITKQEHVAKASVCPTNIKNKVAQQSPPPDIDCIHSSSAMESTQVQEYVAKAPLLVQRNTTRDQAAKGTLARNISNMSRTSLAQPY